MNDKVKVTTSDGKEIEVDRSDLKHDNPSFLEVMHEQVFGEKERVADKDGTLYTIKKKD